MNMASKSDIFLLSKPFRWWCVSRYSTPQKREGLWALSIQNLPPAAINQLPRTLIAKQNVLFYGAFAHRMVCNNKALIRAVADNGRLALVAACLLLAMRKILFIASQKPLFVAELICALPFAQKGTGEKRQGVSHAAWPFGCQTWSHFWCLKAHGFVWFI